VGWEPFRGGATIGTTEGGEGGVVIWDEEHSAGVRVTLERGTRVAPLVVTCGIYGLMVHTIYFADPNEVGRRWGELKRDLVDLAEGEPGKAAIRAFLARWQ
jgi:hypothetical protein